MCDRADLTLRSRDLFEMLPKPHAIIFDFNEDWLLLINLMSPDNFWEPLHLRNSSNTHPLFARAQNCIYNPDLPRTKS